MEIQLISATHWIVCILFSSWYCNS